MPPVSLDAADAGELAEMLQFLSQWPARDPGRPGASPAEYVGQPAYGITQLRQDLDRFVFLLGGDGKSPFSPGAPEQGRATGGARQTAYKEAASPPLTSWHAAHATGPPLRPKGCFASLRDSPAGCP
jgi:hypothetical protein